MRWHMRHWRNARLAAWDFWVALQVFSWKLSEGHGVMWCEPPCNRKCTHILFNDFFFRVLALLGLFWTPSKATNQKNNPHTPRDRFKPKASNAMVAPPTDLLQAHGQRCVEFLLTALSRSTEAGGAVVLGADWGVPLRGFLLNISHLRRLSSP